MKRLFFIVLITLISLGIKAQIQSISEKIVSSLNIANVTSYYRLTKTGLNDYKILQVQVDWDGLTGTLDSYVKILQRNQSTMGWTCLDTVAISSSRMKIILNSASGHHTFTFLIWGAVDFQFLYVKNNCTGGIINSSYTVKK
jgi:hypothetical protein